VILTFRLFHSTESYILLNFTRRKNESRISINTISQYQSTHPTSLITKPNSYLYNPDDDDDVDRVKRDATPFVCKGEIIVLEYFNISFL
jgi:hypothetical protein